MITTEFTKTAHSRDLVIDPEYSTLMPDMDPGEFDRLEQNILADGCREPLVVEAGTRIIVDGHQRYRVCTDHHLPFEIVEREFNSHIDAKIWIITHHLGRRNLSEFQRARLALALKPLLIAKNRLRIVGGRPTDGHTTTREELARIAGVSRDTIQKVALIMRNGSEEIIQALNCGSMSIRTASVLVGLPKKEQERVPDEPAAAILYSAERIRAQQNGEKIRRREDKLAAQRKTAKLRAHVIEADAVDWLHTIKDHSADLLFTDPPYSTDIDDVEAFVGSWLALALSKLKATGRAYIFVGAYPAELYVYLGALLKIKAFRGEVLGWTYDNTIGPTPQKGYSRNWQALLYLYGKKAPDLDAPSLLEQSAMQKMRAPDGRQGDRFASWQKPYDLAEMYVRHSTKEGDLVIDPFCGTGTFLLAAADLGRVAKGCDRDPEALAICQERGAEVLLGTRG